MEDLVGKKVRGFKFEGDYFPRMDKHIGEVGEIISVSTALKRVRIKFVKHTWNYPADQIEKHLVKELPKSFACTNTNEELWDKYIEWLNKEYTWDFLGNSSHCPCYGIDKNGKVNNYFSKQNFDTIISLEEWDEIVNGTETKTKEIMKTYTITREQLKKIHDVACKEWKANIELYSRRNPFGNTIEFTQAEVDEMFTAATPNQIPVLENIFGKQTAEIDLSTGFVDDNGLFSNNGNLDHALMCVRTVGKYANKAFVLNDEYNWELVKDNSNYLCLVPTRKK